MSQYQFRKEDIIILDDQQLQRYQAELLKIGKDVAQAFEDYGIEYSLSGGSIQVLSDIRVSSLGMTISI